MLAHYYHSSLKGTLFLNILVHPKSLLFQCTHQSLPISRLQYPTRSASPENFNDGPIKPDEPSMPDNFNGKPCRLIINKSIKINFTSGEHTDGRKKKKKLSRSPRQLVNRSTNSFTIPSPLPFSTT